MDLNGSTLPPETWNVLVTAGAPGGYQPGDVLLHQGAEEDSVLVLLRGLVKVTHVDSEGHKVVLALRRPYELLGELALLGPRRRSATVTATEVCTVRKISGPRFTELCEQNGLTAAICGHLASRVLEGQDLRTSILTLPSPLKVARMLVWLAESCLPRSSERGAPNTAEIPLNQTELGGTVGLSRSAVAKVLQRLRDERVLDTERNRIIIYDLARLRRIAEAKAPSR
ncbi:Crp/Fnr family transcriptional regulator [Rhizohabitans arisaemae]|uniref:Crp/Fnr family transcriptional regulator n=1 Tax=Rhizohabitans arisaemae TaxID=2720610 RepID=UPI0024B0D737|nr:Crp/Fnr family transcriptional regulator [Rhizohabitans arisaemae]